MSEKKQKNLKRGFYVSLFGMVTSIVSFLEDLVKYYSIVNSKSRAFGISNHMNYFWLYISIIFLVMMLMFFTFHRRIES